MIKEAKLAILRQPRSGSARGCSCYFVPVTPKWGAKVYHRARARDTCFKNQRKAARYGLGPSVGESFRMGGMFCYITEIVECAIDQDEAVLYDSGCEESWEAIEGFEKENYEAMEELHSKLRKIGVDFIDAHGYNFGYKNGKLICIDFGG